MDDFKCLPYTVTVLLSLCEILLIVNYTSHLSEAGILLTTWHQSAVFLNPVIYMVVYIKRTKAVPKAHLHISRHYLSACAAENLIPLFNNNAEGTAHW